MPKLPVFSGKKLVAILCKKFGFVLISQKGSHFKLRNSTVSEIITVIVPNHYEIAQGTFHNILRQARIEPKEFLLKILKY